MGGSAVRGVQLTVHRVFVCKFLGRTCSLYQMSVSAAKVGVIGLYGMSCGTAGEWQSGSSI